MIQDKTQNIIHYLQDLGKVGIAFSGGVDSSLLAVLAQKALGDKAHIFTIITPYMAEGEINAAINFAKKYQLNHQLLNIATPETIVNNPKDRCYQCKSVLFGEVIEKAKELGIAYILDGSNADDVSDYRPGMQALKELKVKSPFLELGITKAEVRTISKDLGLDTWDTPSNPCLLTRLPYDKEISLEAMKQVEKGEEFLKQKGFFIVRVRHEGSTARIEVPTSSHTKLLALSSEINEFFTNLGFTFVALDLKGFASGNMNQTL
ncbi:MAG: ATP-dependent sacrificial sulfur transferase LarE [Bacteroidales bacterium]|jgi:uncharacterized protein|nr:ATP-dependent sacrificial sulfur transferase LarE [Bacteroidales bacterium]